MYIMCAILAQRLNRRVGALQTSMIIIIIKYPIHEILNSQKCLVHEIIPTQFVKRAIACQIS